MKKIPKRSCIVCREKLEKNEFYRIVRDKENKVFFDKSGKANGRGAYCCKKEECIDKLSKVKIINSALKTNIDTYDIYPVIEEMRQEFKKNKEGEGNV